MITAVDSSVLLSVFKAERDGPAWLDELVRAAALGNLIICEVVAAEVSILFAAYSDFVRHLEALGITLTPANLKVAFLAGEIFQKYRAEGGPREHLIPDFLIAAHALECADVLLARDRGYMRKYFKKLKVVSVGIRN